MKRFVDLFLEFVKKPVYCSFSCMKILKEIQMAYMDAGEALNPKTRIYDYFNMQVATVYNIIAYTEFITEDEM